MKRAAWMLAIGFGCTAMVAAQAGSTQTSGSPQSGANRSSESGTITVTGCLQPGDSAGATGTTGSTGGSSTASSSASRSASGSVNGASFILTNATLSGAGSASTSPTSSSAAGSTAGTAGTTGTSTGSNASMSSGSTYILEGGSAQSQLASNAGKRVEVTGTLDTSMSKGSTTPTSSPASTAGTAGSTSSGATASSSPTSSSMSGSQHLRVASIRVIGETCR